MDNNTSVQSKIDAIKQEIHSSSVLPWLGYIGRVVNPKLINDTLDELLQIVDAETKEANRIKQDKERILSESQRISEQILIDAEKRVKNQDIVKEAQHYSNQLIEESHSRAAEILREAEELRDELISDAQKIRERIISEGYNDIQMMFKKAYELSKDQTNELSENLKSMEDFIRREIVQDKHISA